jgi:hypothetical protein
MPAQLLWHSAISVSTIALPARDRLDEHGACKRLVAASPTSTTAWVVQTAQEGSTRSADKEAAASASTPDTSGSNRSAAIGAGAGGVVPPAVVVESERGAEEAVAVPQRPGMRRNVSKASIVSSGASPNSGSEMNTLLTTKVRRKCRAGSPLIPSERLPTAMLSVDMQLYLP